MDVRRLGEKDVPLAEAILKQFGEISAENRSFPAMMYLTNLLSNETCYVIAAIEQDTIVGFVLAYRFPSFYAAGNTAYLYDIEVAPERRRSGIGRHLIARLLMQLRQDSVTEIWLGTSVENIAAQRLFEGTGAQKESETFYEYFYFLNESH